LCAHPTAEGEPSRIVDFCKLRVDAGRANRRGERDWDKAAEHAARCAPYLHHNLVFCQLFPRRGHDAVVAGIPAGCCANI